MQERADRLGLSFVADPPAGQAIVRQWDGADRGRAGFVGPAGRMPSRPGAATA